MKNPRDTDYRSAGFGGRVGFGSVPALVVIDLVMSYFDKSSPMYAGVEQIIASNQRLIEVASRQRMPIFFTKQFYEEADDNEVYARKVPALNLLRPGSPLAELHPAIATEKGIVLVKRFPSLPPHRTRCAISKAERRHSHHDGPNDEWMRPGNRNGCFAPQFCGNCRTRGRLGP